MSDEPVRVLHRPGMQLLLRVHRVSTGAPARTLDAAIDGVVPDEAAIDLDASARALVARAWLERAASERTAAAAFSALTHRLVVHGAPRDIEWLAARAASDELRHAALCERVATLYAGETLARLPLRSNDVELGAVPEALRLSIQVLALSCIQETLGAAFLDASYRATTAPAARAALHALLTDEIDHGRLGWGYLASLDQTHRAALEDHVERVMDACLSVWEARIAAYPPDGAPRHGLLPRRDALECVLGAAETLVVEGLAHVGIKPDGAVVAVARRRPADGRYST